MVTAREVDELVADRPELRADIEAVLDAEEPFTFDDLPLDSGAFGELVAAGIVEEADDGYHVADRDAVERGLAGDAPTDDADAGSTIDISVSLPTLDRRLVAALGGALLFLALTRTVVSYGTVFRDGAVVLSGNDPYYYRYWVEQLLANPDVTLESLPDGVTKGEPLYVATMWALAAALGGGATTTGQLLAWFPVVSAVISGSFVYLIATEVSEDRRVGIAAVLMLAVVAGHGLRTSLGFPDHHAFDYPWLGLTGLAFVALAEGELRRHPVRTLLGTAGLAVGVSGQVLAWEAGPLLVVPAGLVVAALAVVWVRAGRSPLVAGTPMVVGLGAAAAVTWGVHTSLGWHTPVVASAPALLAAGAVGVLLVSEGVYRVRPDERIAAGAVLGTGAVSVAGVAVGFPEAWATLTSRAGSSLFRSDPIAETQGLFSDAGGWLLLFGFVLIVALPYLAWATRRALDDEPWVVPVVYAWAFFVLSAIQVRFVGEFATFVAVFAGLAFVHIAERVDVARLPKPFDESVDGRRLTVPNARQVGALVVVFLLVGGLGLVQVPIKTDQITTEPEMYDTAAWIADDLDDAPDDRPAYVFSLWGHNRMYNYFASGDSRSYGYARANYERFLASPNETAWYDRLRGRAGYVVYHDVQAPPGSIAKQLEAYGSRTENTTGLSHYRAVHVSESGEYRVFTLVPGATLAGSAEPNATVTVATTVEVSDVRVDYERQVRTDANGNYTVTVPYPGTYDAAGTQVEVSEEAVLNGTRVAA